MTPAEKLFTELHEPERDRRIPTLDDWSDAIVALRTKETPIKAVSLSRSHVVVLCADCRFEHRSSCRCPSQSGYDDKLGAGQFFYASTIRQHECHGKWWEPKE